MLPYNQIINTCDLREHGTQLLDLGQHLLQVVHVAIKTIDQLQVLQRSIDLGDLILQRIPGELDVMLN